MFSLLKFILLLVSVITFNINAKVLPGIFQTGAYINDLKNKNIALVINQTSTFATTHIVDSFHRLGIKVKIIFAPEHGFRGTASAGTHVNDTIDKKTGIKVISLYGNHKKPTKQDVSGIDLVVFDIQDVGVRFYTFISTMHYVMETCAEFRIPFMVLDRPNPNGHYVDGPLLEPAFKSFVGMHPIPLVHGCTVGELAEMINNEKWLVDGLKCDLKVIKCKNYTHQSAYELPIKPSPNLQTQSAIYLYPSLGLFEGTVVTVGHGTGFPYQCFGAPFFGWGNLELKPISIKGVAESPKFIHLTFKAFDLTDFGNTKAYTNPQINLNWLLMAYKESPEKGVFFTSFFEKLIGTASLRKQIISGMSVQEIRQTWQKDLKNYNEMRTKYLLYP